MPPYQCEQLCLYHFLVVSKNELRTWPLLKYRIVYKGGVPTKVTSQGIMSSAAPLIRDDVVQLFQGLVAPLEAKDIEIGIYNATIDFAMLNKIPLTWQSDLFKDAYMAKCRSVFANLNSESYIGNTSLIERLKDGEFYPHDIATMPREHVFPEKWRAIQDAEDRRLQSAYEMTQSAMSDQITCGKCKKKKVSYYELQTRSGDESMTTFYTCLHCGNQWKC